MFVLPSRIEGTVLAPPSKSVMVRVAAAALLADRTTILNPSHCDDARSCLRVIDGLGAKVRASNDVVRIEGGLRPRANVLDCGESGLTLRMFIAVAALAGEALTVTGRPALLRRPTTDVETPLRHLGAECATRNGYPPVQVRGPLRGGETVVDGTETSLSLPTPAGGPEGVAGTLTSEGLQPLEGEFANQDVCAWIQTFLDALPGQKERIGCGEERDIDVGWRAAMAALEGLDGREINK